MPNAPWWRGEHRLSERLVQLSRLKVGDPLPCDVRDGNGTLLLCRGHTITSNAQIETLIRYASSPYSYAPATPERDAPARSPLAMVLGARRRLQVLFSNPAPQSFSAELLQIVADVHKACRANADVALASILLCRDEPYAIRHSVNVAIASCIAGSAVQMDESTLLSVMAAALTMNIGMLELQERLLAMKGRLDQAQRAEVQGHCERGVAMLREYGVSDEAWLEIVRDHHERHDGSGYPAGRKGDDIGMPTQLVSLADVYCARVSDRRYRSAMPPNVALRWLFLNEGAALNPQHAAMFIKTLGVYPPGTGVRLQCGSVGVVTQRSAAGHRPRVASITSHDGARIATPIRHRDDSPEHAVVEVVDLAELGLSVNMESMWGADAIA